MKNLEREQQLTLIIKSPEFSNLESSGIYHFFTTQNFGHINIDNLGIDRKIISYFNLSLNSKIIFAGQPHGNNIAFIDSNSQRVVFGVDGLITNRTNLVLVIRTADCLPILFATPQEPRIIGAVHAGRLGLIKGLIEELIKLLIERKYDPKNFYFLIGPHICGKCYSLKKSDPRTNELIDLLGEKYFSIRKDEDEVFLDLFRLTYDKLINNGINPDRIFKISHCTYESNLLPSYRRSKGKKTFFLLAVFIL